MEAIETKQIHIRFTRALSSYDNHADAQHRISRKLASLLPHQANVRYKRMLEIGCGRTAERLPPRVIFLPS